MAEGDKLVREYLQSPFEVTELYADPEWLRRHGQLVQPGSESFGAAPRDLERITSLVTAPEVIAVVRIPHTEIDTADYFKDITLVLDGIRDPGNLGTIIRTADWFGIRRIVASDDCAEHWNPKVVQSSMGSLIRVQIVSKPLPDFFNELKKTAAQNNTAVPPVYGTFMNGENVYTAALSKDALIVIGNEANGIRSETESFITKRISIPSYAGATGPESLNAAIATALTVAEFRRR